MSQLCLFKNDGIYFPNDGMAGGAKDDYPSYYEVMVLVPFLVFDFLIARYLIPYEKKS